MVVFEAKYKEGMTVLVEIVKLIQKQGMRGKKGGWKEFLKVYDTKLGDSLSDPARRSPDVLLAFTKLFKEERDVQVKTGILNSMYYPLHSLILYVICYKMNLIL